MGHMLHQRSQVGVLSSDEGVKPDDLAQGLAAEVRSDIAGVGGQVTQQVQDAINQFANRLSEQLSAITPGPAGTLSQAERMNRVVGNLERRTPEGLQLLRRLSRGMHLSRDQYLKLTESAIAPAVAELRRAGLLLPMRVRRTKEPVYWIPGAIADLIELGSRLVPDPPADAAKSVDDALREVGYEVRANGHGSVEPATSDSS